MDKTSQFWASKISNGSDCKYPFNSIPSFKSQSEFCEKMDDPYIEKLVKKIEQRNKFRSNFDFGPY